MDQPNAPFVSVCDHCDSRTAHVFCMSDGAFLCQSCDVEIHSNRIAMRHLRVPYTQCPIWAYREAKAKGRLRDGVFAQPTELKSVPPARERSPQAPAQQIPGHWGSAPVNTQQPWLGASCNPGSDGWVSTEQARQLDMRAHHTSNSAVNYSMMQQVQDLGSASSFPTVPPDADQHMACCWTNQPPVMPHLDTSRHLQVSSNATSSGPVNTPTTQQTETTINPANSINHNLASLLEEFKLPDGSAEDNPLLELPASPSSGAQGCLSAHQHHFQPQQASQAMDVRQLAGSLKSTNTALVGSAPDFDGPSPLLYSSPCSQSVLGSSLQQHQLQPRDMLAAHMAQHGSQWGQHMASNPSHQFGNRTQSVDGMLASYTQQQRNPTSSSALPAASTSSGALPAPSQQQQAYPLYNINRSNPLPIGNGSGVGSSARNTSTQVSQSAGGVVKRGMIAPEDERSQAPRVSLLRNGSGGSGLASYRTSMAGGQSAGQDGSVHGGFAVAAMLAGTGGVASLDDAGLAAMLGNKLASSPAPSLLDGSLHGGSLHGGSLYSAGFGSGSACGPSKGVSHLIETASAASIEARAQALINSSSRTQQAPVFDPNIVMRIERPDGTIRELDPERAMQLHRYRQKRLARMKAFTEGQKKIRYECRKQLADSRPRVRGRFAKVGSFDNLTSLLSEQGVSMGVGEHSMRGANSYAELMQVQRIDEEAMFDVTVPQPAGNRSTGHGRGSGSFSGGPAQQLRRANSCNLGPGPGPVSPRRPLSLDRACSLTINHHPRVQRGHYSLQPPGGSAPTNTSLLAAAVGVPFSPSSSGQQAPSTESPCLASTTDMVSDPQDIPTLGAELDAAIAAACEQECMTVTDQELAAMGFGPPLTEQHKSPHTHSEGSSESRSTRADNQQLRQNLLQQLQQGTGRMSPLMMAHEPSFLAPSLQDHTLSVAHLLQHQHLQQQQQYQHHQQQQAQQQQQGSGHLPFSLCMDSFAGNEFADQQVSSMLNELLQEAPGNF